MADSDLAQWDSGRRIHLNLGLNLPTGSIDEKDLSRVLGWYTIDRNLCFHQLYLLSTNRKLFLGTTRRNHSNWRK